MLAAGGSTEARAQAFPPPLSEAEAQEVAAAIEAMKRDPRGPYARVVWFCADGTVQPPIAYACRERGGGVQHAELNERARRLAELNVHVGTILQSLTREEFFDSAHANYRLKEYVLEGYLFELDDGWALRRARYYRGARQIEDEEAWGQAFLEWVLSRNEWTRSNFLLVTRLVASLPHDALGTAPTAQRVRNLATEIAERDSAFMPLRIKIHSYPSSDDSARVAAYLSGRSHEPTTASKLTELRDALARQYGARRNIEELQRYERRLQGELRQELSELRRTYEARDAEEAFVRIARIAPMLRQRIESSRDGRGNLLLADLLLTLNEHAIVLGQEMEGRRAEPMARQLRLRYLERHFALAYALGFLSHRERGALKSEIAKLENQVDLSALEYKSSIAYLARSLDWSTATARSQFGPAQRRYLQFEPKAVGLIDALVRGSTLLALSNELGRLSFDADDLLGTAHELFGQPVSRGLRGLNPGVARGELDVLEPTELHWELEPTKIYVIPETTPEIKPPAGVLTLDSGNLLSHVQLLARNLGIPNASVASSHLSTLRSMQGREVFYAVTPLGVVVLKEVAAMTEQERALLEEGRRIKGTRVTLDTRRLRLDRRDPIPLTGLRALDSGVTVGPKAANLGELAAFFPEHVSAGVALPFGMFYQHVDRPFDSDRTVLEEWESAVAEAERLREVGRSDAEIDSLMSGALARVRRAVMELEWQPEVKAAIESAVQSTFGERVAEGVFIRSDTNVEDLPEFSGAGLNLTVPHRRSVDDILIGIRRVWTSPFSERAYAWRKRILKDLGHVYPSVLLLASVPSEKSGVLISSGLGYGGPNHLTIATAEGVGGAVDGGDAEMIVVDLPGALRLLSQAKAPERRVLVYSGGGGVRMVAARRPEYLLSPAEIAELREVVDTWDRAFGSGHGGRVWDVEFGFAGGTLWLFQIRPFVASRSVQLLDRLTVLDRAAHAGARRTVSIKEATP